MAPSCNQVEVESLPCIGAGMRSLPECDALRMLPTWRKRRRAGIQLLGADLRLIGALASRSCCRVPLDRTSVGAQCACAPVEELARLCCADDDREFGDVRDGLEITE